MVLEAGIGIRDRAVTHATLATHLTRWRQLFDAFSKRARLEEQWCHPLAEDTPYDGFTFGFKLKVDDCQLATLAVYISGFRSQPVVEAASLSWYPSGYRASFVDEPKLLTWTLLRRLERWVSNATKLVCKFDERQVQPTILGRVVASTPIRPLRYANKLEGDIWRLGLTSILRNREILSIAVVNTTWSDGVTLLHRFLHPELLEKYQLQTWKCSLEALIAASPVRLRRSSFAFNSLVVKFVPATIFFKEPRFFYLKEPHCQAVISFHPVGVCKTGRFCSTIVSKSFLVSGSNPDTLPCHWLFLFSKDNDVWRLEKSFDLSPLLALRDGGGVEIGDCLPLNIARMESGPTTEDGRG